jgi:segregation and condensation protein A
VLRFDELFDLETDGIPKLVVSFLAMLELAKEGLIRITQQEAFGTIYVQAHAYHEETS